MNNDITINADGLILGTYNNKGLNPLPDLRLDAYAAVKFSLSPADFKKAKDRYKLPYSPFQMFDED